MANTAKQMKVFGYTPEGLDQEVEKYSYMWKRGGQFSTKKYNS